MQGFLFKLVAFYFDTCLVQVSVLPIKETPINPLTSNVFALFILMVQE